MIEHHHLLRILDYCPTAGIFRWKVSPGRSVRAGAVAGYGHREDWLIVVGKKNISGRRLAWFYMTGAWPERDVRNANGNVHDLRWVNIVASNPSERTIRQFARAKPKSKASVHPPGASGFS